MKTIDALKQKYYTYVPGEFMPIRTAGRLLNRREFHAYKVRRAIWLVQNYRLLFHRWTHQSG